MEMEAVQQWGDLQQWGELQRWEGGFPGRNPIRRSAGAGEGGCGLPHPALGRRRSAGAA